MHIIEDIIEEEKAHDTIKMGLNVKGTNGMGKHVWIWDVGNVRDNIWFRLKEV